ncbi:MAG: hypothetical protein QOG64_1757 [Acidimicrobiaceae bacterium]|nr:hypothetical protein [Acidimicrobiaceae bacterium]
MPFELHPEIPLAGLDVNPSRYGRFAALAAEVGLAFTAPQRVPNSRRALASAEWVRQQWPGAFTALDSALFAAYWVEGRDIGDPAVIDELVAAAGADAAAVRAAVEAGSVLPALKASMETAYDAGVTGTPAWLIDGRALVPGYQSVDLFERVVDRTYPGLFDRPGSDPAE